MTSGATPLVRQLAERYDVDLDKVKGTGVGGRITTNDVRAARPPAAQPAATMPYTSPAPPSSGLAAAPRVVDGKTITYDPYAANPLLDQYKQTHPEITAQALSGGPAPSLFSAGDLPLYTASGNSPRDLMRLPWQVRHAAARADAAGWAQLFETFGHNGTREDAILKANRATYPSGWGGPDTAGNGKYAASMSQWMTTSGVPDYSDPAVMRKAMEAMNKKDAADRAAREAKMEEARQARSQAAAAIAKAQQIERTTGRALS